MIGPGIGSWPARRARMNPAAVALSTEDEELSYAELAARVEDTASRLRDLGVSVGTRVAYLGPNSIDTWVCFFATARAGGIFVSLNIRLAAPEIGYMLADSGSRVLVHGPECAELATAADPAQHGVTHVLPAADLRPSSGPGPAAGSLFPDPIDAQDPVELDDPVLILYTSGTTGRPKGAVLTHANLTWNTVNQLAHIDVMSTDVALCVAPLFHVTGLGQVSMPTLLKGGTVVVVPKFDAGGFLALIARRRATCFSAVPTMLQMMCEHPDWESADLSPLRYVIYGGSAISEEVAQAWLDRGVVVQQGYGMTEASPGVFMALPDGAPGHPVSAGVPHFFTDVRLDVAGESVPGRGTGPGELLVRGPNVFAGYWNRPEETAEVLSEGWYRSGDVVRIEDDGWAHVVDRVKDLIISGGENIYPAEVEAAIVELADVTAAAVVAVPDARWGEVGCAYVVLRSGADLHEVALRAHLEQRLARYKIPRYVELCQDLPRNATGKVLRSVLREKAVRDHAPTAPSTHPENTETP
jgi:fatty-acyl-CoA synthase